ncbi:hypothetical protein [Nostoc sp. UHCC 0252]|uniref:hypothetical protein n=1 Tax=Nostoc sp. UHCC 0252 TaxID=3110241 RepID=UPI003A4C81A0
MEKAVFEAGKALMELRDRRLYRSTHSTFEAYRISRLRENENLEDAPSAVLKHLGELKRSPVTESVF